MAIEGGKESSFWHTILCKIDETFKKTVIFLECAPLPPENNVDIHKLSIISVVVVEHTSRAQH